MHIPQIIYLVLVACSLLVSAHEHGKPRANQNFWINFVTSAMVVGLLLWGGFFK